MTNKGDEIMTPKVGQAVQFNPDGTDRRWHGEITAVHSESTVSAKFTDEDGQEIEKPDIHFCASGEACEVSMCEAASKKSKSQAKREALQSAEQETTTNEESENGE